MSHQDWAAVTWTKRSKSASHTPNPEGTKEFRKLDGDEPPAPKTLPRTRCIQIQKARMSKGMTQKALAMQVNMLPCDLAKIENGTVAPTKKELNLLGRALGVIF